MSLKTRLGFKGAEPLYLVDGTSFLYRGFYAYPDLKRSDGMATGAIYIVLRILLHILREERPKYLGFVMDGAGPTFRHKIFAAYKAQRPKMPEDLAVQIEPLREAVRLLGLSLTVSEGVEADDCIASLAARNRDGRPVIIVASDKDLKQCLGGSAYLWDPSGRAEKLTGEAEFRAETGIAPGQWPEAQALMGDSADNIPGLAGVGPKTALRIIRDFPTLEAVRDAFEADDARLPASFRKKLEGHVEDVFLYRRLTRLKTDVCAELDLAHLAVRPPETAKLAEFLRTYEFRSLLRDLPQPALALGTPSGASPQGAPSEGASPRGASLQGGGRETGAVVSRARRKAPPQLSLFGGKGGLVPPPPEADRPPLDLRHVADAGVLPDCAGRVVGLVPLEAGGFRLALAGETGETEYSGPVADLAPRLAAAEAVAVPSVQDLLRADAAWAAVPLERWFDLGLAAYLLNPEDRNYSFARLRSALFLEDRSEEDAAPASETASEGPVSPEPPVPSEGANEGAEGLPGAGLPQDAEALAALACRGRLLCRVRNAGLERLMRGLEIPLIPVLVAMERRGVRIDFAAFRALLDEVSAEAAAHEARIRELAGEPVNVRSSRQLAALLFGKLGLKPAGKTPGGALSTGSAALEKLVGRHPIVQEILDFRVQEKLRSTYLEPLPRLADAEHRLHTRFNQLATATGRLSSSGPNLQNIPIRGALGPRIRACFVPAPGMLLVGADYSQVELRVLAHFSEDPALIEAFRNNEDIHSSTAALLFDKPAAEITRDERRGAKTINFGLIYGMGPQKLAREMGIPLNRAKEFIERYFAKLATLKKFYEGVVEEASLRGYVTTFAGRRRLLPELHSRNQQVRSQARRQAVNTVIQGSAADIIKLAMLQVEHSPLLEKLGGRLILQVHDELLLEAPEAEAEAAAAELGRIMQTVADLRVPLKVDVGWGRTWAEAH